MGSPRFLGGVRTAWKGSKSGAFSNRQLVGKDRASGPRLASLGKSRPQAQTSISLGSRSRLASCAPRASALAIHRRSIAILCRRNAGATTENAMTIAP